MLFEYPRTFQAGPFRLPLRLERSVVVVHCILVIAVLSAIAPILSEEILVSKSSSNQTKAVSEVVINPQEEAMKPTAGTTPVFSFFFHRHGMRTPFVHFEGVGDPVDEKNLG